MLIVKRTLKTYVYSLKFIWLPIIIMAIALVPAGLFFYFSSMGQVSDMATSMSTELSTISCDFEGLINYVIEQIKSLPWLSPFEAIKTIISDNWLSGVIEGFIQATNGSVYTSAMTGDIKACANEIIGNASVFPIALIIGMVVSFFITSSILRKKTCPRSIWATILNAILDLVLTSTIIAIIVWLLGLWAPSVFITTVITAIAYGFISITEAYIIHRDNKMKYKDVVNVKSILSLLGSYFLLFIIAIIIIILLFLIPLKVLSVILAIPIIIITFIVYNLAAEGYVRSLRKDYVEPAKAKKQKA